MLKNICLHMCVCLPGNRKSQTTRLAWHQTCWFRLSATANRDAREKRDNMKIYVKLLYANIHSYISWIFHFLFCKWCSKNWENIYHFSYLHLESWMHEPNKNLLRFIAMRSIQFRFVFGFCNIYFCWFSQIIKNVWMNLLS